MSAEGRTDPALSRNPKPPPLGGGEFTQIQPSRHQIRAKEIKEKGFDFL